MTTFDPTPITIDDPTALIRDRDQCECSTGRTIATPLPEWVREIRPHQQVATEEIVEAFREVDVVFLDAPTGAGKTLIAEMVRRRLGTENEACQALYVCSDKNLQDQFVRDFPYARVLKGRNNYPTQHHPNMTADDCTATSAQSKCFHCDGHSACPYQIAKGDAAGADLAVLNTSYLLTEGNTENSTFGGKNRRELVIIDEADTLEDMLMSYVEFTVPAWIGKALQLVWPIKGARKSTLIKWLGETEIRAARWIDDGGYRDVKERRRMGHFRIDCGRVAGEIERDIAAAGDSEDHGEVGGETGRWLRDYDTATFTLKPVLVGPYGARRLWRHGRKFLLMSGSIISADEMAESLGLPMEYATITVPMTFPVEHRPIVSAPIANIRRASSDDDYLNLAYAVDCISELHRGERVLVHTVSFHLAQRLMEMCGLDGRTVCSYRTAKDKAAAMTQYMSAQNSILFAPSMDRGVDLPDDACRVVVVAKVPFPSLGDRRTSARLRLPGGQSWYAVQTVRRLVQMTGRGVRSEDDYAVSYILDQQFAQNVWSKSKMLFPGWWREAVQSNGDSRWLMRAFDGKVQQPALRDVWGEM